MNFNNRISKPPYKGNLLKIISFSYFIVFLGHSLWRSTFYNYSIEVIDLNQTEISWLFSIASIPGIFAFFLGYLAHKVSLHFLTSLTILLLGLGLLIIGLATDKSGLLLGTFMISIGFSWYLPLANNICIREGSNRSVNRTLGRLKSLGPLAAGITAVLIYYFIHENHFAPLFIISGCFLLLISFVVGYSLSGSHYRYEQTDLCFSANLWSFYLLNFISGSRSALFKAFIMTQFITTFNLSLVKMSILFLAGNVMGIVGYRLLGKLADKYNSINILTGLYIVIALVFVSFIFVKDDTEFELNLAIFLFLIDSLLFGSAVITDAYLKQSNRETNIIGDLATGMTFFHLAGLLLPLIGNIVWVNFDMDGVLALAVMISLAGAVVSRFMTGMSKKHE